jgi:hypothetical protein
MKEVGKIMSQLNKVVWNVVLMAHITGMRCSCLSGSNSVEVLSNEATGM